MKALFSLSLVSFLATTLASSVLAQIAVDGTTNTIVIPTGNGTIVIEQGDRAGTNLFHSFQEFSVPIGNQAIFNNPNDIANIFSRVTG